jgi:hypothetical protein
MSNTDGTLTHVIHVFDFLNSPQSFGLTSTSLATSLLNHYDHLFKHSPFLPTLPLLKQNHHFAPRVFYDAIHLNVVLIVSKWIFQFLSYAFDAVESERYYGDSGDRPPAVTVDDGEGEDAGVEG